MVDQNLGNNSYPVKVPMIDIHTVGAGGGSIASIDSGGALTVGPESAGADPGPICYGRGEKITVTDANLYLSRLIPEHFLGGHMRLQAERLEAYFNVMASKAGMDPIELAQGILAVANSAMEKAIRVISIERGYDPRDFTLFSFGGAGGMHAVFLARLLNIPSLLIPHNPGTLSATGMLLADIIKDYSQTVMLKQDNIDLDGLNRMFDGMKDRGRQDLSAEGMGEDSIALEHYLDMRYEGQSYEIITPLTDSYIEEFHRLHELKYGYRNTEKKVEIVNLRLRARGIADKPELKRSPFDSKATGSGALLGEERAVFDSKRINTSIYKREKLTCGNRIKGPAIIVEYSSTIVIPPFADGEIDEYGNVVIEILR